MKKKFSVLAIVVALVLMLSIGLTGCDNGKGGYKQVPVYHGMSISKASGATVSASAYANVAENPKDNAIAGDYNGRNDDIDDGDPFEDGLDEGIEKETESTLDVVGAVESIYYATKNEDIYITIHINNPDSYEIMSFTLNGKKYTSYMFEEGSDMENIILKYNVGDNVGIVSYTIDAIKYIDGTAIKDVVIDGNKTVKAGIHEANLVNATISNEVIGTNSIKFDAKIKDNYKLLANSNSTLYALLYDGATIIDKKPLVVGDNSIVWDNLKTSTLYQYSIAGYFDDLSGNGIDLNTIYKNAIYTKAVVLFNDVVVSNSGISWDYIWDNQVTNKVITSLKLYKDDKETVLDVNTKKLDNLLSNNTYKLVAEYSNNAKTESICVTFKTKAKDVPVIKFNNVVSTKTTIVGEYSVTDADNINTIDKVKLFSGDTLIKESVDKTINFDSLKYYTSYAIKIYYHYDLNDGKGIQNKVATYDIKTLPHIDVKSVKVSNTSAVSEGETIYMQATIDNSIGATVNSVVVNGVEYSVVNTSTPNRIFIEIVYNGQFAGGNTSLTIDKINATLDGNSYSVNVDTVNTANVFINGKLEVLSIAYVNEQFEPIDWCFSSDKVYGLIKLNNPTKYVIDSLSTANSTSIVPTKIDDETYYFDVVLNGYNHITNMSLKEVSFHNKYITKRITYSSINCSIYKSSDNTTHYIRTVDDLKNVNGGYCYELANDIDLLGIEWLGTQFNGTIDGKGFAIKNMSYVGTIKNADLNLGLFINPNGIIKNINLVGITFIIDIVSDDGHSHSASVGGISNDRGDCKIINCTVDETSVIKIENKTGGDTYIGGISGYGYGHTITNCTNSGTVTGNNNVGGISGGGGTITNCTNSGTVTGNDNVGGISGSDGIITNCTNSGTVTGNNCVGGISGNCGTITNCTNSGTVTGNDKVGGILGYGYGNTITNCTNSGTVTGNGYVGGISGLNGTINNCINTGVVTGDYVYGGIIGRNDNGYDITKANSFSTTKYNDYDVLCTKEQLNDKNFYINTLGWSEDVWDFSNLDVDSGKYPTLKNVGSVA